MKTSTMLRIYRVTCVVFLVVLALMPLIYQRYIVFATAVITLVLILIAFQVQRLRMLARTIAELDELLRLLEPTRDHLSPSESQRLHRELSQIRAALLRDESFRRPGTQR